jgi:hypothetical protein
MIIILRIISYLGLGLTVVPSILFAADAMGHDSMKTAMTIGMVLWLGTAPFVQRAKQKLVQDLL